MNHHAHSNEINALLDGDLGPVERRSVLLRLESDVALRCELDAQRSIRALVRTMGRRYAAPAFLKHQIRAAVRAERKRKPAPFARWLQLVRWQGVGDWVTMGAACGIVALAIGVNVAARVSAPGEQRLMQAAVANHLRATASTRLVELASSDGQTLRPWLRDHLAFTPPVEVPAGMSAALLGARTDHLEDRSVAAVVYRVRDHVVHAFIWPDGDDSDMESASLQGISVSRWSHGGLRYCVVSDLPEPQLLAFAQSLAQVDATP